MLVDWQLEKRAVTVVMPWVMTSCKVIQSPALLVHLASFFCLVQGCKTGLQSWRV